MKRYVLVEQPGSSTAPFVIVDLHATYAATEARSPTVVCSGTSRPTLFKLVALMNEHWA